MDQGSVGIVISEEQYSELARIDSFPNWIEYIFEIGKAQIRFFRRKLCDASGLQSSYWSQVLSRKTKLSPETFSNLAEILRLPEDVARYGLKLLQLERAGTESLKRFLSREIEESRKNLLSLANRLKVTAEFTEADKWRYVESSLLASVHVLTFLPECRTVDALSKRLSIDERRIVRAIEDLLRMKLLEKDRSGYRPSVRQIHFHPDSAFARRQHANWRLDSARRSTDEIVDPSDLRFSNLVCASRADIADFRRKLENIVAEFSKKIPASNEEEVVLFLCDFLKI